MFRLCTMIGLAVAPVHGSGKGQPVSQRIEACIQACSATHNAVRNKNGEIGVTASFVRLARDVKNLMLEEGKKSDTWAPHIAELMTIKSEDKASLQSENAIWHRWVECKLTSPTLADCKKLLVALKDELEVKLPNYHSTAAAPKNSLNTSKVPQMLSKVKKGSTLGPVQPSTGVHVSDEEKLPDHHELIAPNSKTSQTSQMLSEVKKCPTWEPVPPSTGVLPDINQLGALPGNVPCADYTTPTVLNAIEKIPTNAEKQRLAEAEAKRQAEEKRLAEAEAKRQAEKQRLAEEAEAKRLAEEAEAKRLAKEAEKKERERKERARATEAADLELDEEAKIRKIAEEYKQTQKPNFPWNIFEFMTEKDMVLARKVSEHLKKNQRRRLGNRPIHRLHELIQSLQ